MLPCVEVDLGLRHAPVLLPVLQERPWISSKSGQPRAARIRRMTGTTVTLGVNHEPTDDLTL